MELPLTINPLKYYDSDTGKPTGEEYWILDANGEEIACMDEKEDARRIVAAVNACEGIDTETLEELVVQFGEKLRAENARLRAENARLLEVLKTLVAVAKPIFERYDENFEEHEMQHGSVSPDSLFIALNAARAAIAAAEGNEPVAMILPGWEDMRLKTSARRPYDVEQHESIIPAPPYNQYQTLQLCERWFFQNQPLAVLPRTKVEAVKTIRDALNINGVSENYVQPPAHRLFKAAQNLVAHLKKHYYRSLSDPMTPLLIEAENALRDPHGWEPRGIITGASQQDNEPDGPDPCDLARDYNDAVQDAEQPTPYDP